MISCRLGSGRDCSRTCRGGLAAIVAASWAFVPATRGALDLQVGVIACAGYVAAMALARHAWQAARGPLGPFFGVAVMIDALALTAASYGVAGFGAPLGHVLLLQLIIVALLGSFRLGLKLALFQVWLLLGAVYLQELGLNTLAGHRVAFDAPAFRVVGFDIALTLLVAAATTGFAAVNERELRRRRADVEELAALTMRLEESDGAPAVAARLLEGIDELHGCERGLVVRAAPHGGLSVLAARGVTPSSGRRDESAAGAPLVAAAVQRRESGLVVHRASDHDALLAAFSDGARLAIVPLPVDEHGCVLIAEQPPTAGGRMRARTLSLLERYAAHAASSCATPSSWMPCARSPPPMA